MAQLFNIPENVMIQHVFPCLDHNDLLRLRRVSKQIKGLADAYLWTPQPGHQGNWGLKIDSSNEDLTLEQFLRMDLPPPSRLHIVNKIEKGPSEQRSFFEDEHLEEFMQRYSKYVTSLRLDKLCIPFTSAKELGFYESLVNLKKLRCKEMITVGGAKQFEEKTARADGSFLIRPATFNNLKSFKLHETDCMESMWNFINGVSNNLEEILHPFKRRGDMNAMVLNGTSFAPVQQLIKRRGGMKSQSKLLYNWIYLTQSEPLELLRAFANCRDNGVMIKNLNTSHLDCLFCDEDGWINRDVILDPDSWEWTVNSQMNYQRNQFVGSVIYSLTGAIENIFQMDLPALEEISVFRTDHRECWFRPRHGYEHPRWPNARKIKVKLDHCSRSHIKFLWVGIKRPNLEELSLGWRYPDLPYSHPVPCPKMLGNCCENLKKLTIRGIFRGTDFFSRLWKWLPLLEDVTLDWCKMLTDNGFVGTDKRRPTFLRLKNLKHLTLQNLDVMTRITDVAFKTVFRHLTLTSFKLSSDRPINQITVAGIKELLTGPFAKTIVKLDLDKLKLQNVSEEQLKEVLLCFRSSKML